MDDAELFVSKLFAVDALAASTVTLCKVSALEHKTRDDAMEY